MNKENMLKWVEDLETTIDPQAQRVLTNESGDCCLGRLCKVAIADGVLVETKVGGYEGRVYYDGTSSFPPPSVEDWVGISAVAADDGLLVYSTMNDARNATFKEIAAQIRKDYDL